MQQQWLQFEEFPNFESLRNTLIEFGEPIPSEGRIDDLHQHLEMLLREFSRQSALAYYHAWLIVHIRRGYTYYGRFESLWASEMEALLKHLNTRWLVSACDTIIDNSRCNVQRASALAASILANTTKLYETERALNGSAALRCAAAAPERAKQLFDGMTTFMIGNGDMIHNLYARIRSNSPCFGPAGAILTEIAYRLSRHETVFKRLADLHSNPNTAWWV